MPELRAQKKRSHPEHKVKRSSKSISAMRRPSTCSGATSFFAHSILSCSIAKHEQTRRRLLCCHAVCTFSLVDCFTFFDEVLAFNTAFLNVGPGTLHRSDLLSCLLLNVPKQLPYHRLDLPAQLNRKCRHADDRQPA